MRTTFGDTHIDEKKQKVENVDIQGMSTAIESNSVDEKSLKKMVKDLKDLNYYDKKHQFTFYWWCRLCDPKQGFHDPKAILEDGQNWTQEESLFYSFSNVNKDFTKTHYAFLVELFNATGFKGFEDETEKEFTEQIRDAMKNAFITFKKINTANYYPPDNSGDLMKQMLDVVDLHFC